jgi:hypothetical protein
MDIDFDIPYWFNKRLNITIFRDPNKYRNIKVMLTPTYKLPELFDRGYKNEWFYSSWKLINFRL